MSARILIVDDDVLLCDLVRTALERAGFTVESAHSAQAALERLKTQPADLVLLDVMMTDINGFDMLRRMKGDPALASIQLSSCPHGLMPLPSRSAWKLEPLTTCPSPSVRLCWSSACGLSWRGGSSLFRSWP